MAKEGEEGERGDCELVCQSHCQDIGKVIIFSTQILLLIQQSLGLDCECTWSKDSSNERPRSPSIQKENSKLIYPSDLPSGEIQYLVNKYCKFKFIFYKYSMHATHN